MCLLALGCGRHGFEGHEVDAPPGGGADGASDAMQSGGADGAADAAGVVCPAAYTFQVGASRYRSVVTTDDWIVGEQDCEADGTHLVVLQSAAERDALVAIAGPEVWVGVTDRVVQDTWREVTGGLATYLPWEQGEPVSGPDDCVYWMTDSGEYRSQSCNSGRSWICECDGLPADPASY
jgi:hypothetical protein